MTDKTFAAQLAALPAPQPTLGCSCGAVQAGASAVHIEACTTGQLNPKYMAHQKLTEAILALVDALEFYADPETYFAIGFFPDPPCGEFMEDFEEDHKIAEPWTPEDSYGRHRPGKRARAALEKLNG